MKQFQYLLLLTVLAVACQYPVKNAKLPAPEQFIVIDAEVTPNYAKVNVTFTLTEVTSLGGYLFPARPDAYAYILDNNGVKYEISTDNVKDTSFQGIAGNTYQLIVETGGQRYESAQETMRACPDIGQLTPLYAREPARDQNDFLYDGFDVYAELQDEPGVENYYQWDWIHYERTFFCEYVTLGSSTGSTLYKVPCTPYDCWGIKYNNQVIVQSDKLRDGTTLAKKIVRVAFATPPNKYYLKVEQRAITPTVFDYLKSIETQTQNTGSVFDVPAQTRFNPNVVNVDNPQERILGVFNVFSSQNRIIYIDMLQKIDGAKAKTIIDLIPLIPNPLAQAECTENTYRTQIRPEGWVD